MDLDQWADLDPSIFKQQLIDNYDTDEIYVVDIYNSLIQKASHAPSQIAMLAETAAELFGSLGSTDEALLFLELHVRCHLANNDINQAISLISQITAMNYELAESIALELVRDIVNNVGELCINIDRIPKVISQVESVFQHYGKKEEIIDLYIQSAFIYSRHGASQAAYRCVVDAEKIAHELQSLPLLALCYSALNAIACEEPDFRWAIDVGEKALCAYQQSELNAPANLLSNLGMAHMNIDELEQAANYFERALSHENLNFELESVIKVNLSICLRRQNRLSEAEAVQAAAESTALIEDNPEFAIEFAFSAAKLACINSDIPMLIQRLHDASKQLDLLLSDVLRLHHRRGLRERYIIRIEALLHSLPTIGNTPDALLPVVATRGNAMADWLAILDWAEQFRTRANIPQELAVQIDYILNNIRNIGAPHLYGFLEKYDDPWEPIHYASIWDEFSLLCSKIMELDQPHPLARASTQNHVTLCQSRLAQGHCLMATTYAGEEALLWYFIRDQYKRVAIPLQPLVKWHSTQLEYANGSKNRSDFIREIENLTNDLSVLLDPVFEDIANENCISIRYIEDALRDIPLMLFAKRNTKLTARMTEGEFQIRLVPAMVEPLVDNSPISVATAIFDSEEDLLLAEYEGEAFTQAAGLNPPLHLSSKSDDNWISQISSSDVLLVSTHGHSLAFFSDAYLAQFGNPNESHIINVASLQKIAPDLPIRLAILNTCYSGSSSSRNYQKRFRTSDSVAIPNLFLLNRRAVALAGSWKISDTASFIVAHLIGEGLKQNYELSTAVARAIAYLPSMTRSKTVAILTKILPESIQDEAICRLNSAPEQGLFSHPYFSAGLAIHGLL